MIKAHTILLKETCLVHGNFDKTHILSEQIGGGMTKNEMMKITKYSDFVRVLFQFGYRETSCKGSHRIFKADNRPTLSIPNHNGGKGEIAVGTRREIIKLILGER